MRAMRQFLALSALLLVAGCGDDSMSGPDLSAPADMTVGPDIAVRMPDGVSCGTMSCGVGQSCCVTTNGTVATSTCIAAGGMCTGGAVLACDGPEDCSTGSSYCCGTVKFSGGTPDGGAPVFQGGTSSCTATCDFTFGTGQVKTRLCHDDVDCTGLMTANKCCSSTQAPGLHFCALAISGFTTCP
ncbi:MAG: hypothetical protein JWN44_971 [Myxococcales bacterium]|nr:hypothetical protein [Myxococcales bacterium]